MKMGAELNSLASSAGFSRWIGTVSPISNRQNVLSKACERAFGSPAGWKPAKQQVGNLRYFRWRSAFTLVEMLVVVAIIGIVMAIGIPQLSRRLDPDSMDKAVKDMMQAFEHARAYAILASVPVDVVITTPDVDTCQISLQPAGGARTAPVQDTAAPEFAEPVFEESTPRPTSPVSGETLNFTAQFSQKVGIELMEVNFELQDEYSETRIRFFPKGICDECKIVLYHTETGERRLITLEVTTALADVESDPKKFR